MNKTTIDSTSIIIFLIGFMVGYIAAKRGRWLSPDDRSPVILGSIVIGSPFIMEVIQTFR